MTEEEAKTKWCPFARVREDVRSDKETWGGRPVLVGRVSSNRNVNDAECIASSCMAWRVPRNLIDADGYANPNTHIDGFCGLAGAAQ